MERNGNEQNKQTNSIQEKHIIENLKKYYDIDDSVDLLKFIKKHTLHPH